MDKLKLGKREVLAIIVATFAYLMVETLQRYLESSGFLPAGSYSYFKLRVLVTVLTAAMYGPVVGTIVAGGSALLTSLIFAGKVSLVEMFIYMLSGVMIGSYADKLGVLKGKFSLARHADFNVIQTLTNLCCSLIFIPVLFFMFEGHDIRVDIITGLTNAIGNIIGTALVGTPILVFVSKRAKKMAEKKN